MKCAILAGGTGSRLGEQTQLKPKPMVEIGGRPILWHIMRHYDRYGVRDFAIALGHLGEVIRNYGFTEPGWTVRLVDTGEATLTGGRIKRLAPHLAGGAFFLTWGDGVSNVDLEALHAFHKSHGRLATLTAVHPPARFGHIELDGDRVTEFSEKPQAREGWISGAFFVLEPGVLDYIDGDQTAFEHEPLSRLAREGQLMAFRHAGFWQCMDTPRDRVLLEKLWCEGAAPWKTWA